MVKYILLTVLLTTTLTCFSQVIVKPDGTIINCEKYNDVLVCV